MSNPETQNPQLLPTDDGNPYLREIKAAQVDGTRLTLELTDGCTLAVPLTFFPTLQLATDAERQEMEVFPYSLHWESLDCDLGIEGLLQGAKEDAKLADKAQRRVQQSRNHVAA